MAEVRATELNSGREVWGETKDLSKGGCYVRTRQLFPEGAMLQLQIKNQGVLFLTEARVAYALELDGMGVAFVNVSASQLPILKDWLTSAENRKKEN